MAKVFVSVDGGKSHTKVKSFRTETEGGVEFKFATKITPDWDFKDDMFERGTFLAQIDDGPIYKVGSDGKQSADMETSKKSEVHKVCIMAAVAYACGHGADNEVSIAVGLPLQSCSIPEERISFKEYVLGELDIRHVVKIKSTATSEVIAVGFKFVEEKVYPEGIGVIYEHPEEFSGPTGIIDIGGLNLNGLYVNGFVPYAENCFTDEAGGKSLIATLAQQLTSELGTRCDAHMVEYVLNQPYESRYLVSQSQNKELEKRSKEIINSSLLEHVRNIKSKCDFHHWSMEFMKLVCIGGTSRLLAKEIKTIFGDRVIIPANPEYINVRGFLRKLCADNGIDLSQYEKKEGK